MTYYKIIRSFRDQDGISPMVRRGLTLEQAQAHCKDPETHSATCTTDVGRALTESAGPWFDCYEEE